MNTTMVEPLVGIAMLLPASGVSAQPKLTNVSPVSTSPSAGVSIVPNGLAIWSLFSVTVVEICTFGSVAVPVAGEQAQIAFDVGGKRIQRDRPLAAARLQYGPTFAAACWSAVESPIRRDAMPGRWGTPPRRRAAHLRETPRRRDRPAGTTAAADTAASVGLRLGRQTISIELDRRDANVVQCPAGDRERAGDAGGIG